MVCSKCKIDKSTGEFFPSNLKRRLYHCKKCTVTRTTAWQKKNREKLGQYQDAYHWKLKKGFIEAYSGGTNSCACCGEADMGFLSLDHINGGGRKHRLAVSKGKGGGGSLIYAELRRLGYPPGYRVLCYNCNLASGFLGECPHKKRGS